MLSEGVDRRLVPMRQCGTEYRLAPRIAPVTAQKTADSVKSAANVFPKP